MRQPGCNQALARIKRAPYESYPRRPFRELSVVDWQHWLAQRGYISGVIYCSHHVGLGHPNLLSHSPLTTNFAEIGSFSEQE